MKIYGHVPSWRLGNSLGVDLVEAPEGCNKIYFDLKNEGYKVYPANSNYENIKGDKCYSNLKDLPELPEVVNIVIPPKAAEKVVKQAYKIGIKKGGCSQDLDQTEQLISAKKIVFKLCIISA